MNVLCGITQPDEGTYSLGGNAQLFRNVSEAESAGVFRVHQEQALISAHRVCQNMFLGLEKHFSHFGVLRFGDMEKAAQSVLDDCGISIPAGRETESLSFGERQLIEVARVVAKVDLTGAIHPLVLLDEPTASLSGKELEIFYAIADRLKNIYQASMIFVSHRLEEIVDLSDRILVMKDGKKVRDDLLKPSEGELHRLMVGRERIEDFYAVERQRTQLGETVLTLEDFATDRFDPLSIEVRSGEVVGIGGLAQSGKHELGRAIFGLMTSRGRAILNGRSISKLEPSKRVEAGAGYVPLDRHSEGVMLGRSVDENIAIASLKELAPNGILNLKNIEQFGGEQIEKFRIKTPGGTAPISSLSGGNQQKAVLARWLAKKPAIFVVDNPTRGVDAGAKEEIYSFLRDFTDQGGAVLLISDDLVELIEMSNRVALMSNGTLSEFTNAPAGDKPSEHDIIHMMF